MKLTYVTNLNTKLISGGWSGMNNAVLSELISYFEIDVIDEVNPRVNVFESIISKLLRTLKLKGNFYFFSENRLSKINSLLKQNKFINKYPVFFHGVTPWIKCNISVPYYIFIDASFHTYINVYSKPSNFISIDLERIYRLEKDFLAKARMVFCTSEYCLNQIRINYDYQIGNLAVCGTGGSIGHLISGAIKEDKFLFVSNDFNNKGGHIVYKAFKRFKIDFPGYKLIVVGDCPNFIAADVDVDYLGFLDKTDDVQSRYLAYLYESAKAFLLPSNQDMTPLVIAEALSCGCPVISVDRFGISEMINSNIGFLYKENDFEDIELFFELKMRLLANNAEMCQQMSDSARFNSATVFSWKRVGEMMKNIIMENYED